MATSLFGPSPLDYQQAQQANLQQQASQYAQLNPLQRAAQGMYQAGSNIGGGIAGLMGIKDPMAEKASKIESILQGSDQTSAAGFADLYRKFSEAGLPQQAQLAAAKAQEFTKAEAEAGLTSAKTDAERALVGQRNREKVAADPFQQFLRTQGDKVTPESLAIYQQTGNVGDLEWITKANKTEIQQLQDYRDSLPINSPKRAEVNEVIKGMGKGKGTTVQNILPGQGAPNVSDVTSFVSQANTVLKPFKTAFENASEALSLLETGNPKAGAQVDRLLAGVAGDSQLSQAEVTAVASAGSFPQRVADSVSKFFTGGVGSLSTEQKKEVLTVFQTAAKDGFNNERQRLSDIYGTSRLSPEQVKAGLGEPLKVNTPKATASPMKFDADKEKRYLEWKAKQTAQPK